MSNAATGKAAARIESLLDANSFVEIGKAITARSTDFNMNQNKAASDGVITGYGVIDGRLVYVYSQDSAVLGGTIGEMHAKKIAGLYDMAMKTGAPIIGLIDCAGVRLQEGTDALEGFGLIFSKAAEASGMIPQVTATFGTCGGGMAVLTGLTDFNFIESKQGHVFVNSPNALAGNYESKCDTSSAEFQSRETGLVDGIGTEDEIIDSIRQLVSLLPSNCEADDSYIECEDDLNRSCDGIDGNIEDASVALSILADNGEFFEVKKNYGIDMVCGLMRLNGSVVGAVANRSVVFDEEGNKKEELDGTMSGRGARKAAAFVNFCDAFGIPVLTLTNVGGFHATLCSEKNMASAVSDLVYAFAQATVPKVNVITGKAYGTSYIAMNSKALGADMTFAWDSAEVGMMDASVAAKIMYPGADAKELGEKAAEYRKLQSGITSAAQRGYVDTVIAPEDTRKYVIGAFEMLFTKAR